MSNYAKNSLSYSQSFLLYPQMDQEFALMPEDSSEIDPISEVAKNCFDQLKLSSDETFNTPSSIRKKRIRDHKEEVCLSKRPCFFQKKEFVEPEAPWDREDPRNPQCMSYSLRNMINSNRFTDNFERHNPSFIQQSTVQDEITRSRSFSRMNKSEKITLFNIGMRKPLDFGFNSIEHIVDCFKDQCSKIKKLDLTGCVINRESIKLLGQHFKSLESLCLSGCRLQKALPYIGEIESLVELDLSNSPDLETLNGLETLIDGESCSKLSYINLSNTPIQNINALSVHINLKKIELKNCKQIKDILLIQYLSNLSHLDMNGCDNLKCDIAIFKNLLHLERLDFGKCPEISGALNDLKNLKKLKYFNVGYMDLKKFSCADDLPHLEIVISEPRPPVVYTTQPQSQNSKESGQPRSTRPQRIKNQPKKAQILRKNVLPKGTVSKLQKRARFSGY